jgi:hypothetical protein
MQNIPVFMFKLFVKVFTFLFRQSASTIAPSENGSLRLEQRKRFILENRCLTSNNVFLMVKTSCLSFNFSINI